MKLTTLALSALIALLAPGLTSGQSNSGFPPLPPVLQTGQLADQPGATKFTFIVAGDNRPNGNTPTQPATLSWIISDAQRFKPAFFLWCGDTIAGHTNDGSTLQGQYAAFLSAAAKANVPLFNAPGNHEMDLIVKDGNNTNEVPNAQLLTFYLQYMLPPNSTPNGYGAFTYGKSRFIAVNTEEVAPADLARSPGRVVPSGLKLDPGFVSPEQFAALTQDLENNKDQDHIFVFMHHPIKPNKTASALNSANATKLEQLFGKYSKVSYVLAAHEHLYYNASGKKKTPDPWTGKPPIYLVTGGGGAPLDKCGKKAKNCREFYHYLVFTVDGPKVTVQVISQENKTK